MDSGANSYSGMLAYSAVLHSRYTTYSLSPVHRLNSCRILRFPLTTGSRLLEGIGRNSALVGEIGSTSHLRPISGRPRASHTKPACS